MENRATKLLYILLHVKNPLFFLSGFSLWHSDLDVVVEGGLGDPPLVGGEDLRQLVGDGQVELVEGAALEEGAGALK